MGRKRKANENRGVSIGGNVTVENGDFVAGNKTISLGTGSSFVEGNVTDSNVITGDNNILKSKHDELFDRILKQVQQRPGTSSEDREELKASIEEFKIEADKGERANETFLSRRLRNIQQVAPDIAEVILATIANPATGFAVVVKKVAEHAAMIKP